MKDKMNINQVERLTGVLKRNIRFFEKEGLFLPKRNRENGYCVYGETEIWRIKTWLGIMEMKRKAISILLICYVVLSLCACGKYYEQQRNKDTRDRETDSPQIRGRGCTGDV